MVYLSGIREQIQGRSDLRTRSEDIVKSFTPQEHAKIMLSRQAIGASRFGYMDRLALAQNLRSEQSLAETFELLAQYNGGTRPPRESY